MSSEGRQHRGRAVPIAVIFLTILLAGAGQAAAQQGGNVSPLGPGINKNRRGSVFELPNTLANQSGNYSLAVPPLLGRGQELELPSRPRGFGLQVRLDDWEFCSLICGFIRAYGRRAQRGAT